MPPRLRCMTGIYLRHNDRLLLLYRMGSSVIDDSYTASAGGHFEKDELNDPRACVLRELYEETGLFENDISNLSLRYISLRLKNGEIRQNYYFFADLKDPDIKFTSDEGKLKWFTLDELHNSPPKMPYSAHYVVRHYIEKGQYNDTLYVGATTENGMNFTEMKEF